MMQIISVALAVLHAVGNLARADKNLYADTGVLKSKILKKNTNFSKKILNYNYWPPVQCAYVISKLWQSSIHSKRNVLH